MMTLRRRLTISALCSLVLLAACGGSSSSDASDTTAPSTEASTTSAAPTTEAVVTTTEAPAVTDSTVAPAGYAPLTGLPVTDAAMLTRPALAAKIDNHTDARPHAGLNQADIVYEEIVEGITRFFAIFQSQDAAPLGPVRSARTTDVNLLNQLNRPFLVFSGGNAKVVAAINGANAEIRAHADKYGYYRDSERRDRTAVEHTLLLESTAKIYETRTETQGAPSPFFAYRADGAAVTGGRGITSVDLNMNSVKVTWSWTGTQFIRSEYGEPHVDTAGAPISAENVVVQFCDYKRSAADPKSPEAITVGSGDALIYTDGQELLARWDRPDAAAPAVFTLPDGSPVELTPGRTWIELAQGGTTPVTAA